MSNDSASIDTSFPLPWALVSLELEGPCEGKEPYPSKVLQWQIRALSLPKDRQIVAAFGDGAENELLGQFIVRACNSYDALLMACELAVKNTERAIGDPLMFLPIRYAAEAAIAQAKEKPCPAE